MNKLAARLQMALTMGLVVSSAFVVAGCPGAGGGASAGGSSSSGSSRSIDSTSNRGTSTTPGTSTGTTSTSPLQTYRDSYSVKVIFNKKHFYSNTSPSPLGCGGDARHYFSPLSDRQVPVRPDWLKNIAVELTNSNAANGPSRATGCSLSGLSAPPAANCAAFDDLQPLSGSASRSVLVGGFGCRGNGSDGCATSDAELKLTNDIWNLVVPDLSTNASWQQQSSALARPTASTPTTQIEPGLMWHSGGYDELHDQFYTFGGVHYTANTLAPTAITNDVHKMTFTTDGNILLNPGPSSLNMSSETTRRAFYAGWAKPSYDAVMSGFFPPPAMTGPNFTFGLRRDPSHKSFCRNQDDMNTSFLNPTDSSDHRCESSRISTGATTTTVVTNEHSDYFLLTGGMRVDGYFSDRFYMYKPHAYSNDIPSGDGSASSPLPTNGDWTLLSNVTGIATASTKVMSIVDIGTNAGTDVSSQPYAITAVAGTRVHGDTFDGWVGRAHHRTVYDPGMNRFYIYGGLVNNVTGGVTSPATTVAPDVATSDVWIYDPPALGRRPTSTCYSNEMPELPTDGSTTTLPVYNSAAAVGSRPMGATKNLDVNRHYATSKFVFPPGGCLQRIKLDGAMPPVRFEHGMVFDRDAKALFIFGGCNKGGLISTNANKDTGNPLKSCTAASLLNDTWMYVPPSVTEIMPQTFRTATAGPYNASTLLGNVFGTNFWLDHLPLFSSVGDPQSGELASPADYQALGRWIRLSPATKPTPRAGAQMVFDRAKHRIYLMGGFGCTDANCSTSPKPLNDLWEYLPPSVEKDCDLSTGKCGNGTTTGQGLWTRIREHKEASNSDSPTPRFGGVMAHANSVFANGDEYYTVTDRSCSYQGPISTNDTMINKQYVGAIYVDIDRSRFSANENLLVNLRFLPYDKDTRLPGYFNNNTQNIAIDDTDKAGKADTAVIRVQLMSNPLRFADQIQASVQPRYHEFISGTQTQGDTFVYVAGPSGQVTERQIHVPLSIDPTINMIKIERVQGSIKFYEMTVTKF